MSVDLAKAKLALVNARRDLIARQLFYGSLSLELRPSFVDWCDTGATDGENLVINPGWFLGLEPRQRVGFVAHEVGHCALLHPFRRGGRDLGLWNEACDHVINLQLKDAKLDLPPDPLIDERFREHSVEQVFSILQKERKKQNGGGQPPPPQPPPQQDDEQQEQPGGDQGQNGDGDENGQGEPQGDGQGDGDGEGQADGPGQSGGSQGGSGGQGGPQQRPTPDPGGCGGVMDPMDPETGQEAGDSDQTSKAAEWGAKAAMAAQMCRSRGMLPGGLERALDASSEPEIDWRTQLRDVMQQQVLSDYSYSRPNQTLLVGYDIIVPGLKKENAPPMLVVIDASGSVTQDELDAAASEIKDIVEVLQPESIRVLYHDTRVTDEQEFDCDDDIVLKTNAGGGTDFRPVFKHVEDEDLDPVIMVFFTDTYGPFPTKEPDYPVVWVTPTVNAEDRVPFGEVVEIR